MRKLSIKKKLVSRWGVGLLLVVFLFGTFLPSFALAAPQQADALDVIINEVAWAGTESSSDDEWIELYSPIGGGVDLTGWRLVAEDGYPDIILYGQTSPDGFFLLERAHRGVINNVPSYDGADPDDPTDSNQVYFGALDDDGEVLRLRAPDGTVIDIVDGEDGWSHGRIDPASSMERMSPASDSDDNWVTNINQNAIAEDSKGYPIYGTPGEENWGYTVSHTATPVPTLTPTPTTSLAILINEVAWFGTEASPDDEWIELYNPGNFPVDLGEGWTLRTSDEEVFITLTGTIDAKDFYLLERGSDNVILPNTDYAADQVYDSGLLDDEGAYLRLYDPSGKVVIDTANKTGGSWDAGVGAPDFYSMERRGVVSDSFTAWMSNVGIVSNGKDYKNNPINGTPLRPNWAISVDPTPSPLPTRTPIPPTRTPTPYPFQSVVLNEVLPRPGYDWNQDGVVDANDEFIEIINRGQYSVSLSGWKLDDEYNLGSLPYTLPDIALGPGERIAIFGYTSHISLSDGGDTVRLLKNNGEIADAVTYTVVKTTDQSWCRLPERGFWNPSCFPTPNEENAGVGDFPAFVEETVRASCFVPDTAPDEILLIECGLLGMSIYDREFWEQPSPGYWLLEQSKYPTWYR